MSKSSHLFIKLLAAVLALTLFPFSALAVTEDKIEPAPEISLTEDDADEAGEETPEGGERDGDAYRPSPRALPARGTVGESEELNLPRLTDTELALVRELTAARAEGPQPEFSDRHYAAPEKVFEAGVYPLDPEAFGGNTFYVILPYAQMNRDQLLSLISAFEELGIPFNPDSLNSENCVRGTSLISNAATRRLSGEEENRMEEIRKLIRRDIFDRETFTAPAACRSVQVQLPGYENSAYDYLTPFSFYPYRAMTDDELASFALAQEATWEIHPDHLEKKARQYARQVFSLPLSMTAYDETRFAYSESYIEFRQYFRIDAENSGGLYASPDETPYDVMVEQDYCSERGVFPQEASLARILIDYPAMYGERTDSQAVCGEEELKAAARRWAEKYLLVPEDDILTEWAFDMRDESWGTVQYRLLTTEWLVTLEMLESDARCCQCCIYDRDSVVEFDDWVLKGSAGTSTEGSAEAEGPAREFDQGLVDSCARQSVQQIVNLPGEMTLAGFSRDNEGYVQYRTDYTFRSGEDGEKREPAEMIVYQTPYFTDTIGLRLECFFLSYPDQSGWQAALTDGEFRDAARKWADRTLKIPAEEILEDWCANPSDTSGVTVTYQLETAGWTVYLQMYNNGVCSWAGFYPRTGQ